MAWAIFKAKCSSLTRYIPPRAPLVSSSTDTNDKIIFLFCGLLTVVYSISVFLFMPDSPMTAKFLTEDEKIVAVERLRANQMGIVTRKWRWDHVFEVFYDVKTWGWFFIVAAVS